jgi:hypothetical protein
MVRGPSRCQPPPLNDRSGLRFVDSALLDAETGRLAYLQDANYLKMIQQPER